MSKLKLKNIPSDISLSDLCEIELTNSVDFKDIMMDLEYYLYQLFTSIEQDEYEYHQMIFSEDEEDKTEKTNLLDILSNNKKINQTNNFNLNYENEFIYEFGQK